MSLVYLGMPGYLDPPSFGLQSLPGLCAAWVYRTILGAVLEEVGKPYRHDQGGNSHALVYISIQLAWVATNILESYLCN